MKKELIKFLSSFPELDEKEIAELADLVSVKDIKKNTILVSAGTICSNCYFVLRGCLRQYLVVDGVEKTIAFYTENEAVNFFTSVATQQVTESYLCSLEDSLVMVGDPVKDIELFERFPALASITRGMMEKDFGKTQDALAKFITCSAEERYLDLLKDRPGLLQRVPQHQLASYLGVTPESLSRIRKRILIR